MSEEIKDYEEEILEEEKKEDNLTFLYNVLFKPKVVFKYLSEDIRLGLAFFVFIGVAVLTALTGILFPVETELQEIMYSVGYSGSSLWLIAIGTSLFSLLLWFVVAGVLGLTAEMLGGKGSTKTLFAGLGFAQLPQLFMIPGTVVAYLFLPSLHGVFSIAISIWVLYLYYRAIKDIYGLSTGRAIGALIMPWIALVLAIIVIVVVFLLVFSESLMFLEDFYYMMP